MGLFNWIFRWLSDRAFDRVDVDKSGFIEPLEVELAVYHLYHMVNKRLPGCQDPPSREVIQAALALFDEDGNKKLDRNEFAGFAKDMLRSGPDAFFARIGKNVLANGAILPAASFALKSVASGTLLGGVPLVVLSPLLGTVYKSVRSMIPC